MTLVDVALSILGVCGAAAVAWLTLREPSWAIAMVTAAVPLQAYSRIGTDDVGITWTQGWLWSFLAVGVLLLSWGRLKIQVDVVTLMFGGVVVCYVASRHSDGDPTVWLAEVYRWSIALAFFVVARSSVSRGARPLPLLLATGAGATWTALVATVQVVVDVGPDSFDRAGRARAFASFGEPNTFGAFAAGCLVIGLATILHSPRPRSFLTGGAITLGAVGGAVGLVLSQSRGATAAAGLVIAGMVALKVNAHSSLGRSGRLAAVVILAVAGLVLGPRLAERLATSTADVEITTATWADGERLAHWAAATAMIVESGGFGVGAGQFDSEYRAVTPTWRFRIPQGHAHNAYLQVAAEAGMVALGAYLALLTSVFAALARTVRRQGPCIAPVGALAVTAVFALHNLVDYLHVLNLPIALVAWWAVALGQSEGSTATP